MNIIATMALRRALGRTNSVQSRAAAKVEPNADRLPKPCPVAVDITGPINRYMLLQGRTWAIDMVASLRAAPVELVIERLTGAAIGRPASYAAGIASVIAELRVGDSTDQCEDENLIRQAGRRG